MTFQFFASVVTVVSHLTMKGWNFTWERSILVGNHKDFGRKKFDSVDEFLKFITEKGYEITQ